MGRPRQKFVAPGPDDEPLPTGPSPWHSGRWARLPKEHWDLILDFAETLDHDAADKLRAISFAADDNDMDLIETSPADLKFLTGFIDRLRTAIEHAPPLVPEVTDDVPDRFENEEHVRMLDAVDAVLRESIRVGKPFRAWNE